jgi:hypothetical protein
MNIVMIVPTGIGAEIGGDVGDANPVVSLLASCCDNIIVHPNVVNAGDLIELPFNAQYVEGSQLDSFLRQEISLEPGLGNHILVACNKPMSAITYNSVAAARTVFGVSIEIVELDTPLDIRSVMVNGKCTGTVAGVDELVRQVGKYKYDALALHTPVYVNEDILLNYMRHGGINPVGGAEAVASRAVAKRIRKPIAHAPCEVKGDWSEDMWGFDECVHAGAAPDAISNGYLISTLKGLSGAPRIVPFGDGIMVNDINFMVSPVGCWGPPHEACAALGIPILVIDGNRPLYFEIETEQQREKRDPFRCHVANYLEAAGYIKAVWMGLVPSSVLAGAKNYPIKVNGKEYRRKV